MEYTIWEDSKRALRKRNVTMIFPRWINEQQRLTRIFFPRKVIVIGIWNVFNEYQIIENRVEKRLWNGTERMRVSWPILRPRKIRVCVYVCVHEKMARCR